MDSQRDKGAECVIGKKPVLEFLRAHPDQVDSVYLLQGRKGSDIGEVVDICKKEDIRFAFSTKQAMDRLFPTNHQGFALRRFGPGFCSLDELLTKTRLAPLPVSVALDQVQDPGNVGTLARTLWGLGGGGLLLPKHNAAYLGVGAVKSSAGTLALLAIARETNLSRALDAAREEGFFIYGTMANAAEDAEVRGVHEFEPAWPALLVLGGEHKGVRPGIAKRCDMGVSIPLLRELDSLNVAQAGAIILGRMQAAMLAGAKR